MLKYILRNRTTFADGNGMNYFLVIHNHPPIVIYAEDCKGYYDALESWDSEQKLDLLCDFLKQQTKKLGKNRYCAVNSEHNILQ